MRLRQKLCSPGPGGKIQAEVLKVLQVAFLSFSLLYVMYMLWPKLHESFPQSRNRNLQSSLASPAHKYLQPAILARLDSCWHFPIGPAWKNCKAQIKSLLLEALQMVFTHQYVCKAHISIQLHQPEVPSPNQWLLTP